MSTRMEPGEKLDDATIEAANARLAAKLGIGPSTAKAAEEGGVGPHNIMGVLQEMSRPQTGIPPAIDPALRIGLPSAADLDAVAAEQKAAQETAHKRRSDFGTKRGPIVRKEPEAAMVEAQITVNLTGVQIADLHALAARLLATVDLRPEYLVTPPADWLLNARVQKHWRTLIGK